MNDAFCTYISLSPFRADQHYYALRYLAVNTTTTFRAMRYDMMNTPAATVAAVLPIHMHRAGADHTRHGGSGHLQCWALAVQRLALLNSSSKDTNTLRKLPTIHGPSNPNNT